MPGGDTEILAQTPVNPHTAAMLLIFPPIAKACEPPAGIARLAGCLQSRGITCRLLDANLEAQLWLLHQPSTAEDTWTRRALRALPTNLVALRDQRTYNSFDRYSRAMHDLNRLLAMGSSACSATVGLADYQHGELSPLRSADLLRAAEQPERNPFYPWFSRRLTELVEQEPGGRPPVVGFSLTYLSQALCTFAMLGFLRQRFPGLTLVLGGGLVTSWMSRSDWRNPFGGLVDHMVAGAGEEFLLSLHGIEPAQGPMRPDYGTLPLADYLSPGPILPYSTAAGCYWNRCSFCPERAEGSHYLPQFPQRVLGDLHHLVGSIRPTLLHLLDNALTPAFLQAIANDPPGCPWYGFARIGTELADLDFCRTLRKSGCVMLKLGLESGDQGVLDRLHKGIDLGITSRVLENLRQAGIAVYLYLLFGTPAETEAAARRTLDFVIRHQQAIGFLNLAIFNMPLADAEACDRQLFYDGDLSLYTGFRHPEGWDRKRVRTFLDREFKRHPAVAAIVRRDPPLFTSNHAALFVR